ncbi:unnamed protein product [Cunninghamella blakesleeana]
MCIITFNTSINNYNKPTLSSKLNELVEELNKRLEKVNNENKDFTSFTQMWSAYNSSVQIHLESTQTSSDPL